MGGWFRGVALAVAVVALASCQSTLRVVVTPELAELLPLVEQVAGGLDVALEDASRPDDNVLRLTTSPGWNLPAGSAPGLALPTDDLARVWPLPAALANLGRGEGGWTALPLLYDPWGVTSFVTPSSAAAPPAVWWTDLVASPGRVHVAGGSKAFRQAAFLLSHDLPASVPREAAQWFRQPVTPWSAALADLPQLLHLARWERDAWSRTRADLDQDYQAGSVDRFVETYQQYELANPAGTRRFVPLASGSTGQPTLVAQVVFVEYRGRDARRAAEVVAQWLATPLVKRAGQQTKWLAASPAAPEVDGTGAGIRHLLSGPATLLPVTERLPEGLSGAEAWSALEVTIETTPR